MTNYEKIDALIEAGKKIDQGDWYYRPLEYDDWGYVRDKNDGIRAIARSGEVPCFDKCRLNKIDPFEPNGRFIAAAASARTEIEAMRDENERLKEENRLLYENLDSANQINQAMGKKLKEMESRMNQWQQELNKKRIEDALESVLILKRDIGGKGYDYQLDTIYSNLKAMLAAAPQPEEAK